MALWHFIKQTLGYYKVTTMAARKNRTLPTFSEALSFHEPHPYPNLFLLPKQPLS